ncbi:hypothetical protein [uncultured Polaribacter sp.]|jgi:hypothetical protein|uniref:hypothetical protein n=1 Tax=uncultured Polaribacter sp. TaxID=174711 RepID=UPI0030DB7DEB|tara:strand:+ start:1575 stop:1745 length:171 start_codon:yes stop_codon:yes gene_type:complete
MKEESTENKDLVSRKEAFKKMGKYAALTAIGTFILLSPKKAQAESPSHPGSGGGVF